MRSELKSISPNAGLPIAAPDWRIAGRQGTECTLHTRRRRLLPPDGMPFDKRDGEALALPTTLTPCLEGGSDFWVTYEPPPGLRYQVGGCTSPWSSGGETPPTETMTRSG